MKFHVLPVICLLGCTIAAPMTIAPRDLVATEAAIRRIGTGLKKLENGLRSITPKLDAASQTQQLIVMDQNVVEDLRTASRDIRRGPNFSQLDGARLMEPMNELLRVLQQTSAGWIEARPMVNAANMRSQVYDQLLNHSEADQAFGDTICRFIPFFLLIMSLTFTSDQA